MYILIIQCSVSFQLMFTTETKNVMKKRLTTTQKHFSILTSKASLGSIELGTESSLQKLRSFGNWYDVHMMYCHRVCICIAIAILHYCILFTKVTRLRTRLELSLSTIRIANLFRWPELTISKGLHSHWLTVRPISLLIDRGAVSQHI